MEEKFVLKEEFIKQAESVSRGAELLPGGIKELAIKLQKSAESGVPIRVKLGMDPTRPDLHLGHTVVMRKLKKFQEMGHKIVLLVGGATAMVGDPSGKSETRPALTKEQVDENAKTYFEQMSKVLDTSKAEVVNNADWLHPMQLTDLLKLASNVTVAQMMTRDDFAKRYAEGKPISIHEFFYPLMQAYDSVAIDADLEIGGTDQRFNVLLGREIQSAYGKPNPQMVMLLPLLEGTDGIVKMSKTYPEHCISLTDSAKDMYGKLMSIPDTLIIRYYSLLTDVTDDELKAIEDRMKIENPRNIKMELAYRITNDYHSDAATQKAQDEFVNVVQNKGIPEDIPSYTMAEDKNILDLLLDIGFVTSKGEAKRLIAGGGVKLDNEKVTDTAFVVNIPEQKAVLQAGKRKFMELVK